MEITGDTLKEGAMIVLSFTSTSSTNGGFGFGGMGGGVRVQKKEPPVVAP